MERLRKRPGLVGPARALAAGLAGVLAAALACAPPPAPPEPPPPRPPPPRAEPAPPCERIVEILVHKAERELVARCEGGGERTLHVALGRAPEGPKLREGDWRTPEGRYRVLADGRPSRFHRFVPIDYPSAADADTALAEGRISALDHRRILEAHAAGRPPPSDTPLGGDLGFHGEGERWRGDSRDLDWTYGCIALRDEDVDFLADRVAPGTPVQILPRRPAPTEASADVAPAPAP